YKNTANVFWFIVGAVFFFFGFWTKIDISLVVPLTILFWRVKNKVRLALILTLVFFVGSAIFVLPFGFEPIWSDVIDLRNQAFLTHPFNPFALLGYPRNDLILFSVVIGSIILFSIGIKSNSILFWWGASVLFLLFLYRPLFPHHLVQLTVPFSLFLSSQTYRIFKSKKTVFIVFPLFFGMAFLNQIAIPNPLAKSFIEQQEKGVKIILANSKPDDHIVSDEAILNTYTNRLPPPELVDMSFVRIRSGNLSSGKFGQILDSYRPRLVIAWNGRLQSMKGFEEALTDYRLVEVIGSSKKIYRLKE
ncbi:hypothetical protein HYW87_02700, partial [Candidatus Roizmanbacteria bacterium]|nr:hypothetical protein [Candidatus Roizmanbacteria bacterium]